MDILHQKLQARGYAARIAPIARLRDLEEDIQTRYERGMFDADFYKERLTGFDFSSPEEMPGAKSVIVLAVPSPQTGAVFHRHGKAHTLILPPTYVGYATLPAKMEALLNGILNPLRYRALKAGRFPLKPLAVRSGLAEYGRNNITYVKGMGSFHHLFAFYSDLPCERDAWRAMEMLKRCEDCRACVLECPTGAIREDRFLLRGERCIVFHNERPADVPFPAWIDPSWHNSIFGCMTCQRCCPENRKFRDRIETCAEFSEEETALLLDAAACGHLPAAVIEKLDRLELSESRDALPRNLGVLLDGD
jgi:epoxyqueuosine reductase